MATNNAVNQSRATFNAYFAASQTGVTGDATNVSDILANVTTFSGYLIY